MIPKKGSIYSSIRSATHERKRKKGEKKSKGKRQKEKPTSYNLILRHYAPTANPRQLGFQHQVIHAFPAFLNSADRFWADSSIDTGDVRLFFQVFEASISNSWTRIEPRAKKAADTRHVSQSNLRSLTLYRAAWYLLLKTTRDKIPE